MLTNGGAGTPGPVQNRFNKIVFSATLQLIATVNVVPVWNSTGIDVEFDQGLYLQASTRSAAAYTGTLALQVVWYQ